MQLACRRASAQLCWVGALAPHMHKPPRSCSERVPRFAWALVLLLLLEALMLWRYQPWAVPIEVAPPPAGRVA